ncbi:MAG: 30S ribosomal protein S5 [bacterium]|nr:30S ribosomal protein S5 [bacterium]
MPEETKTQDNKSFTGASERRVRRRKGNGRREKREPREFEQKILELARVTRVTKGGKRMSFRTCLIIGDKKGRVGMGVAKGTDVAAAVEKAFRQAKKNLITVPIVNETIPHRIDMKFGAAQVMLKPAPKGTGLKSGGPARMVLEFAGVPNVVSKILGSKSKINNAKAMMHALSGLRNVTNNVSKPKQVKTPAKAVQASEAPLLKAKKGQKSSDKKAE